MDDVKTFEKNNPMITLNILFIKKKKHLQPIFQKFI